MRDLRYEQFLRKHHTEFDYLENIPLGAIDWQRSLKNQARLTEAEVDPDRVDRYRDLMKEGTDFPALIAWFDASTNRYVLITGNHRFAAARTAHRETIDLYNVIQAASDEYLRELLTRFANEIEGVKSNERENERHAVWLVKRFNKSATTVANMTGVPVSTINALLRQEAVEDRLAKQNLPYDFIGVENKRAIYKIQNDLVLADAARLIHDARVTATGTKELVAEILAQGTEQAQLSAIQRWRDRPEIKRQITESRKAPSDSTTRHRFMGLLRQMQRLTTDADRHRLQLSDPDAYTIAQDIAWDLMLNLEDLFGHPDEPSEQNDTQRLVASAAGH